jgi:NAD(P)H-dependent FMN reductase
MGTDHAARLTDDLSGAFAGARALFANALDLLGAEAWRASVALAVIVACGALGAIVIAAAWLGAMGALALWAMSAGFSGEAALASIALGNAAIAGALLWLCVRLSRELWFPASRRQLRHVAGR